MVDSRDKGARAETIVRDTYNLYRIFNINAKCIYIGITKDINTRFREHKNYSSNRLLRALILGLASGSVRSILKGISYKQLQGPILGKDYYLDFGKRK